VTQPAGVPDDARELHRDLTALRREQRAARVRARLRRVLLTRRWDSHGISGPLVALALLVVGVFGLGLALLVPTGTGPRTTGRLPLAHPAVPAGQLGGLLPAGTLRRAGAARTGAEVDTRELRPAVVGVLPPGCRGCRPAVEALIAPVSARGLQLYLVAPPGDPALVDLAAAPPRGGGTAVPLTDPAAAVLSAYPVRDGAPTLLFVDAAGVLRREVAGYTPATPVQSAIDVVAGLA